MKPLTLTIRPDDAQDCPNDWGGNWTIYSFCRNHTNFKHPDEFIDPETGEPREDLQAKLDAGLAFWLDCYQHGGITWSLHGTGMQCRWDTARKGGIAIWENPPEDMGAATPEARAQDCTQSLQTFNQWCNGECFYFLLEDEDGETVDSCGGFYDLEPAVIDYIIPSLQGRKVKTGRESVIRAEDIRALKDHIAEED